MKRKSKLFKIKPIKGNRQIFVYDISPDNDVFDFIRELGYFIYEVPNDNEFAIISDKVLTYGDLKKQAAKFQIDLKWWNEETDFNEILDQELDEWN